MGDDRRLAPHVSASRGVVDRKATGSMPSKRTRTSVSEGADPTMQRAAAIAACVMAERAGFEPATGCPEPHFQCGAIVH